MTISIISEQIAPKRDEITPLLDQYYKDGSAELIELGGPVLDPAAFKQEFWEKIDDFLPPNGRFYSARDEEGRLLGFATLSTITPSVGELKRVNIDAAFRGQNLGRRLVEGIIEAARELGLKTLTADILLNGVGMQHLCESLGFRRVDLFEQSATHKLMPEVSAFMVFVHLDLED